MLTPDERAEPVVGAGVPALVAELAGDVVLMTGELDLWAADAFSALLDEITLEPVDVDLSGVTFLDSMGVRALVRAWTSGRVTGYVGASDAASRVLEVSGLADELLAKAP